jgi:hypothetical protein
MSHTTRITTLAATLAALALGATPAAAQTDQQVDQDVFKNGVPAGQVEHGKVRFTITGSPTPTSEVTEYWATDDAWRSRTMRDGEVVREALSTPRQTVYLSLRKDGTHRLTRHSGPATAPLAGWTAAYNRKLVERGTIRAIGTRTVAGLAGVLYEQGASWKSDNAGSRTTIVLEEGTFAPLLRRTTSDNGRFGTFRQTEELLTRERVAETPASIGRLSAKARAATLRAWRARAARR